MSLNEHHMLETKLFTPNFEKVPIILSGPFLEFCVKWCYLNLFFPTFLCCFNIYKGNKCVYNKTWVFAIILREKCFIFWKAFIYIFRQGFETARIWIQESSWVLPGGSSYQITHIHPLGGCKIRFVAYVMSSSHCHTIFVCHHFGLFGGKNVTTVLISGFEKFMSMKTSYKQTWAVSPLGHMTSFHNSAFEFWFRFHNSEFVDGSNFQVNIFHCTNCTRNNKKKAYL